MEKSEPIRYYLKITSPILTEQKILSWRFYPFVLVIHCHFWSKLVNRNWLTNNNMRFNVTEVTTTICEGLGNGTWITLLHPLWQKL